MTKKADLWMPLYVGDYLADTGHLTTTQHGAYLLLLMHYWRNKGLPDDDKQLAAITKLPLRIWLDCRPTIQSFFFDGWRHKRVHEELEKRSKKSAQLAEAGYKGGMRTQMNHMIRAANASAPLKRDTTQRNTTSTVHSGRSEGLPRKLSSIPVSPELAASMQGRGK